MAIVFIYKSLSANDNHLENAIETGIPPEEIDSTTSTPSFLHRTSTVKKTITEYSRQRKVCILLIQNPSTTAYLSKRKRSPLSVRQQADTASLNDGSTSWNRPLRLPNHIRLMIEILDAHRIDYSIESTRLGLPTSLLTDPDESSQFSVIIIDDFLRYTKLDRWMRDQLDRHCRKNQIGVVTFFNPDEVGTSNGGSRGSSSSSSRPVALTTEESMIDQFPLTLRAIDRRSACAKHTSCQYDYQLNDQSSILRILKRRRDFVVSSSVPSKDSGDFSMPWISMSSDHVTYEPLTWAHFRPSSLPTGNRFMSRSRRHTRDTTLTRSLWPPSTSEKNVLVEAADAKRKQDDYGAYDVSPDGIDDRAAAKSRATRVGGISGVTEEYSKNQLQAATAMQSPRKSTVLDDSYNNGKTVSHVNSTMMHDGSERHPYSDSASSSTDNNTTTSTEEDHGTIEPELEVLAMFDLGLYDGIKRVIFGRANHHWLDRIILLDAIEHLSSGKILTPLERYVQIDIDDIFVGERSKRMNASDVDALIDVQERFSHLVDGGFKFNLGFSGKYFKHGDEIENSGDEYLISMANHFNWFCHTWSHSKAHLTNDTGAIETELRKNLQFAKQHRIPIIGHGCPFDGDNTTTLPETYAVAPHHSGGKLSLLLFSVDTLCYSFQCKVLG